MANLKAQIEVASLIATPGILPQRTELESYIGKNAINLSQVSLTEHQISALGKGLTFCPTPVAPDKSQKWDGLKEFHRCLELMEFFNTNSDNTDLNISQCIIDFMNEMLRLIMKITLNTLTHIRPFTNPSRTNHLGG